MIPQAFEFKKYHSRIHWIDIARCLSIAIIAYAHTFDVSRICTISSFVHLFHVPVFFVLSGLVWKRGHSSKKYCKDMINGLIVPYFIVGILSIVAYQVLGAVFTSDKLTVKECVFGLFFANSRTGLMKWNRPLWFIPCLVVTRQIWEIVARIKKEYLQYFTVLVLWGLSIFIVHAYYEIILPWEFEVALHAVPFYTIGVIVKRHTNVCSNSFAQETPIHKLLLIIFFCSLICLFIYRVNGDNLSFQYLVFNNYYLFVVGALCGTVTIFCLSMLLQKGKMLEIVGQNSLLVLLWHKFPILLFQATPFGKACLKSPNTFLSTIVGLTVVIVTIYLCLLTGVVFSKLNQTLFDKGKR